MLAAWLLPAAAVAAVALLARKLLQRGGRNPFAPSPQPLPPGGGGSDDKEALLKRSFSADRVPRQLDAVVIGSGIGGLSAAALLAKAGQKILVLEQHDVAGGCCHTFEEKRYEFDVGIHYVGEMGAGDELRTLVDQLTDGRLQWAELERDCYDSVVIGAGSGRRAYDVGVDRAAFVSQLCRRFPAEADGVREFFRVVESMRTNDLLYWSLKLLPLWLAAPLLRTRVLHWLSPTVRYAKVGFCEFLDSVGVGDPELRSVLGYCFGDFGCPLSRAPLVMQAALLNHFQQSGAFYPAGGSSQIACGIVPTIRRAGGDVLVRATVSAVVCDASGRATGVLVSGPGGKELEVRAPLVISDAGVRNTGRLLPEPALRRSRIPSLLSELPAGASCLTLFVGLRVPQGAASLGLKRQNVWSFSDPDVAKSYDQFLQLTVEEAVATELPLLFTSFPSLKDPLWDSRIGGDRLTVAVVTLASWDWFSQWQHDRVKHRDREYRELKAAFGRRMWQQVKDLFPQLEDLEVEVFEVGTPVTNKFYINSPYGEIYGLDHGLQRVDPRLCAALRPDIGVKGLLLTGQDLVSCGFCGALSGGLICASEALGRNLMFDLMRCPKTAAAKAE